MNPHHTLLTTFLAGTLALSASAGAQQPKVSYLPFSDKGVSGEEVAKSSKFKPARQAPKSRFISANELSKTLSKDKKNSTRQVDFALLERSGFSQTDLPFSFGFPVPKGELYDLHGLSLSTKDDKGKALPAQFHALSLWDDGSVKSVLVQTKVTLPAGEEKRFQIAYSEETAAETKVSDPVQITEGADQWIINTGALRFTIPTRQFELFSKVETDTKKPTLIAQGGALELKDENGVAYSSAYGPVDSLRVERQGPLEATLRAEGPFYSKKGEHKLLRYVARMRFFANSSRVELSITFINDALKREFTDIRSLGMELTFPKSEEWSATLPTGNSQNWNLAGTESLALMQWDERTQAQTVGSTTEDDKVGRAPGSVAIQSSKQPIQLAYKDFWQRWPKRIEVSPRQLKLDFLPPIASDYEEKVPFHTAFPFVEGRHRSKWGMTFTERLALDFNAKGELSSFQGSLQTPPLVRLPIAYLASTKALGALPTKENDATRLWQAYSERSMEAFLTHRDKERQYGYFNWGDWYGERGCNWGNNEYDIPHGFFLQYLITGDARYFDAALEGARHQADVDIVHAYPDPFYIGGNVQHSIGHTGISYQEVTPKTWTYRYDYATWGGNGHTWADGMADCWLLTGDPVVMDALLLLGEHMTFAYASQAHTLGNHHRSIGWCLYAMAAVHRASSDPVHLEAMKTLATLSVQSWDPKTGIWPYELHPNHALGKQGIFGSSVYNLGILLGGLSRYHAITGDERIPPILSRASDWLVTACQNKRGWPYGAMADGSLIEPNQKLAENLNALIYPPMAYTALITDNAKAGETARDVLINTFTTLQYDHLPKEYSIKAYATPETLGLLEQTESKNNRP